MIATGLTFLFGMLLTALIALLLAPLAWSKAQSLARREFEATIPVSANEIRAEFDRVRADAAMAIRRQEILSAETREKSARTQAELGRATVENVEILKRNRKLVQIGEERDEELANTKAMLGTKDDEMARLSKQLAVARREGELTAEELESLAERFQEVTDIAEERKIQLVSAETKIDRLSDKLRGSERATREAKTTIDRLRGEAASFERTVGNERTQAARLNDRLATLLAGIADRDEEIARLKESAQAGGRVPATARTELAPSLASDALPVVVAVAAATATRDAASPAPRRNAARSQWGPRQDDPAATAPAMAAAERRRPLPDGAQSPSQEGDADIAAIREKISDIAARVIRMGSLAEGPDSPLAKLIPISTRPTGEPASPHAASSDTVASAPAPAMALPTVAGPIQTASGSSTSKTPPSLAERVRRLVEADARPEKPAAEPSRSQTGG